MVKVAIAGGSGDVGQEFINALSGNEKHQLFVLSRKDVVGKDHGLGVTWVNVDYNDPKQLIEGLTGIHTVLSFITTQSDPGNLAQKNLINAAIEAGVKRFAPSEWASSDLKYMPWYTGKGEIREYLYKLNKDRKVLEYTLFQPGMFTNYFTSPYKSSNHIHPLQSQIDFNNRRAIKINGSDEARLTLTTVQDLVNVLIRAIEYEGEWPLVSGIKGDELTVGQLIALGEKIRGGPFRVEVVNADDLKAGRVRSSWLPRADHPSIPPEQIDALSANFIAGLMLGISAGCMNVSDEWNSLMPEYKFTGAGEFLTRFWQGKP